jgi:hypothetical protein
MAFVLWRDKQLDDWRAALADAEKLSPEAATMLVCARL